jgi:hypothetical protein
VTQLRRPIASGADGLCPSEPIAGGYGNPLRVPIQETEIRISPLALIGLTLALGAAFVFIGATLK